MSKFSEPVDCSPIKKGSNIHPPGTQNYTITPTSNASAITIVYYGEEDSTNACIFDANVSEVKEDGSGNWTWTGQVIRYKEGENEQYYLREHEGGSNDENYNHLVSRVNDPKKPNPVTKKSNSSWGRAYIADPGLHFDFNILEIAKNQEIELPKYIKSVHARIYISVLHPERGENGDPFQTYLLLKMVGRRKKIDISKPMRILVPFVDQNWNKKGHYEKDLMYNVIITLYGQKGQSVDIPLYPGLFEKSEKNSGKFVCKYIKEEMPNGMPWESTFRIGKKNVKLNSIIYSKDGVWFHLEGGLNETVSVYLVTPKGEHTSFHTYAASNKEDNLDYKEACFLPYPQIRGLKPLDCNLVVEYKDKEYRFSPRKDIKNLKEEVYESLLLITNAGKSVSSGS